jgi:bacillithiol system protein YtxJ
MNWIPLTTETQIQEIIKKSIGKPQLIFKHSTRCGISSMAKSRLEKPGAPQTIDFYYLDLLSNRSLSNKLAESFQVAHQSPQILLIKNGECVYEESHTGIRMDDIIEQATFA